MLVGCDWSAVGSGQGSADSLQLLVKERKEPAGNVNGGSRGENGMFRQGSQGREGSFLLAASVGAYEGEVLGLTQAFYPFLLSSLGFGRTVVWPF